MTRIPGLRRFFRLPANERTVEAEIADELSFHLESRIEELVRLGWTASEARAQALREFGDVSDARSELTRIDRTRVRQRRRSDLLDAARQDLRLAMRTLRREPGFACAVIFTLALGIGLNSVMFSITDRLMFRPPEHVVAPDQVKRLYFSTRGRGAGVEPQRSTAYIDYKALSEVKYFASTAAYFETDGTLGRGQDAREIRWSYATASFFPTLGVKPHLGRFYTEAEDRPGAAEAVVVLSYPFWQAHFGGERSALGRTLELGKKKYTVIGVTPKGFAGMELRGVDVYMPLSVAAAVNLDPDFDKDRGMRWLRIIARVRPGSTLKQVNAAATARYVTGNPEVQGDSTARVTAESIILAQSPKDWGNDAPDTGRIAVWLSGVSLIVLIIACANVMNLLLARSARRGREVGIRVALGVSRLRLLTHFLIETLVLASLGGLGGLLLARWGGALVRGLLLPDIDWMSGAIDTRTLAYAGVLVLLCGLTAALAPVLHSLRTNVLTVLKSGAREGGGRSRTRTALVTLQATLCVVLLVGSGLFVRSLLNVRNLNKGFDPSRVVAISWDLDVVGLDGVEADRFYREAAERARQLPAVGHAAVSVTVPFWSALRTVLRAEGVDSIPMSETPLYNGVAQDYFATMGTRIVRGRAFLEGEGKPGRMAAIIDEAMARKFWPNQDPIGKCLYIGASSDTSGCSPIVGIAETVLNGSLEGGEMMYYVPLDFFRPNSFRALMVRLRGDRGAALGQLQDAMQTVRPGLPAVRMRLLGDLLAPHVRPWRLGATLFSAFGALALILAAIGLYSVIAYNVTQRTQEMSVRIALGASAGAVIRLVLGEATLVVIVGILVGLAGAVFGALKVAPLLFHVSPLDPMVFTLVVGVLIAVGLGAALAPTARALRIQPIRALRAD
jgi:putative ABC transport system permease protein